MSKIKQFWNKFFDLLDDILAYILTIIGILCSNYLPLLKSNEEININIGIWKIVLASIVALMIIGRQENLDIDENGSKIKAKEGRKKRFFSRMMNALAQGIMWNQLMQLASN
jgi:hypothetical protein